jgi:hypothetical protein
MNSLLRMCLFHAIACLPAIAQIDFRLSGYAVTFPIYQHSNSLLSSLPGISRDQFVDVTRIRLRSSVGLWSDAFLMVEPEASATYSSSPLLFQGSSYEVPGQILALNWRMAEGSRWNAGLFVDRLYVRQTTDIVDLSVGRQRVSWGTGRIWNPTDLFNPINPTSFAKVEKDGVDAATIKFILGSFTDLTVVINPRKDFQRSNYGGRFRTNIAGYDFSVVSGWFDDRPVFGFDWAGSMLDAGVRGEAIVSGKGSTARPRYTKFILGIDNQFTREAYALAEYHYNGAGNKNVADYDLSALLQGKTLNLGKQFFALQASYLIHPLVTATAGYTASITDGSGFVAISTSYSAGEHVTLSAGGQVFHGDRFAEYWYYPSSLYLRLEYFF